MQTYEDLSGFIDTEGRPFFGGDLIQVRTLNRRQTQKRTYGSVLSGEWVHAFFIGEERGKGVHPQGLFRFQIPQGEPFWVSFPAAHLLEYKRARSFQTLMQRESDLDHIFVSYMPPEMREEAGFKAKAYSVGNPYFIDPNDPHVKTRKEHVARLIGFVNSRLHGF